MPKERNISLGLWSLSLMLVLAAHMALIWEMVSHPIELPALNQPLPAIALDLLPPQPTPAAKVEPRPQVEFKPAPHPPAPQIQADTPVVSEETPARPKPQMLANVAPPPTVPAEVSLPEQKKPVKPRVTQKPAKKSAAAPPPAPKVQPVDQKVQQMPPPASPPPQPTPRPAEQESKPAESAATIAAKSNWLGVVVEHIARFKRRPPKHLTGPLRAIVVFNIDRTGKLLSERILQSSGDAEVDDAALAWISRADPLPKPPDDMSETDLSHGFVIPVDFLPR